MPEFVFVTNEPPVPPRTVVQWRVLVLDGNLCLQARRPGMTCWLTVALVCHRTGELLLASRIEPLKLPLTSGKISVGNYD